jgi:hypothetical protein
MMDCTNVEKASDGGAVTIASIGLSRQQWFRLPLPLRQRWWRETDYSRKQPSPDLIRVIVAAATSGAAKGANNDD